MTILLQSLMVLLQSRKICIVSGSDYVHSDSAVKKMLNGITQKRKTVLSTDECCPLIAVLMEWYYIIIIVPIEQGLVLSMIYDNNQLKAIQC